MTEEERLEQERLRELNEALSALIGNIQLTDKAVEKLGKRLGVDKIKEQVDKQAKAIEENTKATQADTAATKKQTEEETKRDKANLELFEREKKRREAQIDADGKIISTTTELTKAQKEQLKALDAFNATAKYMAAPGAAIKSTADSYKSFGDVASLVNSRLFDLAKGSAFATSSLIVVQGVAGALTAGLGSMTKSIYAGERGAAVSAKALTAFTKELEVAAAGLAAVSLILPIGRVAKIVTVALAGLAAAASKYAEFNEKSAEQADRLFKSFNELSQSGLTTSEGMEGVFTQMQKLGMSMAEVEKFTALLKNNSKDLKYFGATAADGAKKFAEVAGEMYKTKDIGEKLELLGVTAEEQREHTLRYMATQTRMGMALGKTQEDQIRGAKEYIEQLDRLSMLTGASKKEMEQAREAAMKMDQLRAAMLMAEKSGDTGRQQELATAMKVGAEYIRRGEMEAAKGFIDVAVNRGGITSKEGAVAATQFKEGLAALRAGKSDEEVLAGNARSSRRAAENVAPQLMAGGDKSGLFLGNLGNQVDEDRKLTEAQTAAAKAGMSVTDYLKAEQKRKEENPSADTKNMVEAGRKQQDAALRMDSVVKTFGGAAKMNKDASEAFDKAVKTFSETVGAKVAGGGIQSGTGSAAPASPTPNTTKQKQAMNGVSTQVANNEVKSGRIGKEEAKAILENGSARDIAAFGGKEALQKAAGVTSGAPATAPAKTPATGGVTPGQAASSLIKFQGDSLGNKDHFNRLDGDVKARFNEMITEFGKPVQVNAAERSVDEQKDLYTRWVNNGRKGNPVAQPGKSKHNFGRALDLNSSDVNALERAGLLSKYGFRRLAGDPPHIEMPGAATGGAFDGSNSGYPVMLHGNETVLNKVQTDKLNKKLEKVEQKPADSAVPALSSPVSSVSNNDMVAIMQQMSEMMENKLDTMISVLEDGNDTSDKLLTYSMA
jgi:hypothetical protein